MSKITKSGDDYLTRGQLSKQTECNIETIRYYEQIALLPEPRRSEGGHRLYSQDDLKRLTFVLRSRDLGFNLDEIRGLLELVDGGDFTCTEVRAITSAHLSDVQDKLKDLRRLERVLKKMVSECEGRKVPDCPIIDALYEAR